MTGTYGGSERLERHWRRLSDPPLKEPLGNSPIMHTDSMTIGVTVSVDENLNSDLAEQLELENSSNQERRLHSIALTYTFRLLQGEGSGDLEGMWFPSAERDIEVAVDEIPLIRYIDLESVGVNFVHPLMEGFENDDAIAEGVRLHPDWLVSEDGWIRLMSNNMNLHLVGGRNVNVEDFLSAWAEEKGQFAPIPLEKGIRRLKHYFDVILGSIINNVSENLSLSVVNASRRVPLDHELIYLIETDTGYDRSFEDFHLKTEGASEFQAIASSIAVAIEDAKNNWDTTPRKPRLLKTSTDLSRITCSWSEVTGLALITV